MKESKIVTELTKQEFKICEAVHLGLTHYYMGLRDKREVTASERVWAEATLPKLPERWWEKPQPWQHCGTIE
jgi:hypothetical protein